MDALANLLVCIKTLHRQAGLGRIRSIGAIVARGIAPPDELSMLKFSLSGVAHGLAFGQHGMPVMRVHAHIAIGLADKYIFGMRDVMFVLLAPGESVLLKERRQCKEFRAVDRQRSSGVQVGIEFQMVGRRQCLHGPLRSRGGDTWGLGSSALRWPDHRWRGWRRRRLESGTMWDRSP